MGSRLLKAASGSYHSKMYQPSDIAFTRKLMRRFGVPKLKLATSDSQRKHPDLWITLGSVPIITVTREWARQSEAERHKRLVHEVVGHLVQGLEHGEVGGLNFSTYPAKDSYSRAIYRQFVNPDNLRKKQWYIGIVHWGEGGNNYDYSGPGDDLKGLLKGIKQDICQFKGTPNEIDSVQVSPYDYETGDSNWDVEIWNYDKRFSNPTYKRGADFTGYIMLKCRNKHTTRVYVGPHFFKGYAADGKMLADINQMVPCRECGRILRVQYGEPVYGRYVKEVICNAKCTGAVGHVCECSCGGKNHGAKYG